MYFAIEKEKTNIYCFRQNFSFVLNVYYKNVIDKGG